MENILRAKCAVRGEPAKNVAQDMREVPSTGLIANKVGVGNWHGGCAAHPAKSRVFYLDGRVTVRD